MKHVGVIWIIVLMINVMFLLVSVKLKNNKKLLVATSLLLLINFGSYFIFYLITNEYISIIKAIEAYLILFIFMSPMIISLILLTLRTKKGYSVSSMIYSDIIALNVTYFTYAYSISISDLVNYVLNSIGAIEIVGFLFLVMLIGKWMYLGVSKKTKKIVLEIGKK